MSESIIRKSEEKVTFYLIFKPLGRNGVQSPPCRKTSRTTDEEMQEYSGRVGMKMVCNSGHNFRFASAISFSY